MHAGIALDIQKLSRKQANLLKAINVNDLAQHSLQSNDTVCFCGFSNKITPWLQRFLFKLQSTTDAIFVLHPIITR